MKSFWLNTYNADETGLFFATRALLRKASVSRHEKSIACRKIRNDRVAILFHASAAGRHKPSIMLIDKNKIRRYFKRYDTNASQEVNQ